LPWTHTPAACDAPTSPERGVRASGLLCPSVTPPPPPSRSLRPCSPNACHGHWHRDHCRRRRPTPASPHRSAGRRCCAGRATDRARHTAVCPSASLSESRTAGPDGSKPCHASRTTAARLPLRWNWRPCRLLGHRPAARWPTRDPLLQACAALASFQHLACAACPFASPPDAHSGQAVSIYLRTVQATNQKRGVPVGGSTPAVDGSMHRGRLSSEQTDRGEGGTDLSVLTSPRVLGRQT
jgi:hypothetical protein